MSYLTADEYVRRFGSYESTLFTRDDRDDTREPDTALIDQRIADASEEVDGYVSRRYAVPLGDAPALVRGWVADITRLKLAESSVQVSEAIQRAADRAYAQLRDLAASKLDIPALEGVPAPEQTGTGDALSSGDAEPSVFGCGALDGLLTPFVGGYRGAAWRRGC